MGNETSRVTNNAGIDLSVAVWLAFDDYDYVSKPNYISATTLIKPIRQIILGSRIKPEDAIPDIKDRISSVFGQTLHTGVEMAWKLHYKTSLAKLGYPTRVIEAVRVNPETQEPDTIPVFTEVRAEKEILGFTVGGKIDLIVDYRLRDVKSTSVWAYQNQRNVGKWKLQGSIYRWLNQEKITHDEFLVQYLLLDWTRAAAKRDPNYPANAVPARSITLLSVAETEQWVRNKLQLLLQYRDALEEDLPLCEEEDLWRSPTKYKYYAKEDAPPSSRSTKNFDDFTEARAYMANEKGGKGRIDKVPGEVKACLYCPCYALCGQKDDLIATGQLFLEESPI